MSHIDLTEILLKTLIKNFTYSVNNYSDQYEIQDTHGKHIQYLLVLSRQRNLLINQVTEIEIDLIHL